MDEKMVESTAFQLDVKLVVMLVDLRVLAKVY